MRDTPSFSAASERIETVSTMTEHQKPNPFPRFYGLRNRQPIPPPIAPPGRRSEKAQITRYRALRDRIHEGPLYTILGDTVRVGKAGPPPAALFDPFLGMPTYTQKYMKQRRKIPRLDTRPYGESGWSNTV